MLDISLNRIIKVYLWLKKKSEERYVNNDFDGLINYVDKAVYVAQIFNWIYKDDDLEKLLLDVSQKNIVRFDTPQKKKDSFKKIVFYDEIGTSTCLSVQYLRALIDLNYDIFYIFESSTRKCSKDVIEELESGNIKIELIDSSVGNKMGQIQSVYNQIISFGAATAILHTPAEGAFGVILWNSISNIRRFRVVPGDHHFYIGLLCSDYFIGFRNFGYTIDIEKRGLKREQVFLNSYYPLINNRAFEGFPIDITDKIVIISAGNYYKIYGGNDIYFSILKQLLIFQSNVVIFYAGDGFEGPFRQFINKNGFGERIYLLGYRSDLNECIAYSDIYLTTYPFTGGLTTQIAAYYSKPILSFATEDMCNNVIDDFLDVDMDESFTIGEMNGFLSYAKRLIKEREFRIVEGERAKRCLTTKKKFDQKVENILSGNQCSSPSKLLNIDYEKKTDIYISIENKYIDRLKAFLIRSFGLKALVYFPLVTFRLLWSGQFYRYCGSFFLNNFKKITGLNLK